MAHSVQLITLLAFVAEADPKQLPTSLNSHAQDSRGNGQDSTHKLVDKLVDKLLDRALKASPVHRTEVDNTMLEKHGHLAVPLQSSPHFITSRLPTLLPLAPPPSLPLAGRPQPFPNNIAYRLSHLEDFGQKSSAHQLVAALAATSAAVAEAEEESTNAAVKSLEAIYGQPPVIRKYGHVEEIHSEEQWDYLLQQSSGLIVLEAVSTRCRACRAFAGKYQRMAVDYQGKVQFLKLVLDENASTHKLGMHRLGVKFTPSFFVFLDGKLMGEESALRGRGNLTSKESALRSTLDDCILSRTPKQEPSQVPSTA